MAHYLTCDRILHLRKRKEITHIKSYQHISSPPFTYSTSEIITFIVNVYQNYRQIKKLLENNSLLMIVLNTISKGKKLEGVVGVTTTIVLIP